jgi:hypothetical protein
MLNGDMFTPPIVMNTTSKLGPHTHTNRGTCPDVGALRLLQKPLRHRGIQLNLCTAFGSGPWFRFAARARVSVHYL